MINWMCACGGRANILVLSGYHAGVFGIDILRFCIHEYNVNNGIIRRKLKKRYQFQFFKNYNNICYWMVMWQEVGGGIKRSEFYVCLVGWW